MFLALFLSPWVLIYALSTMAMNHRAFFRDLYGGNPVVWQAEREQAYTGSFAPEAKPREKAEQILHDLGMGGAFNANAQAGGGRLVIQRLDPLVPRRITFTPADGKLLVEKQVFRTVTFLERMHRRRGFQFDSAWEDTWAASVDLVIVAMVFWALSGLWMWWEMKATRLWGAVSAAGGLALFLIFLFRI